MQVKQAMQVSEAMRTDVATVGPAHTLRDAARLMSSRRIGAAVVVEPDDPGVGIITERDILDAVAAGQDPDTEPTSSHVSRDLVFAAPDWSLDDAATAMVRGGFRHLVVLDGDDVVGVLAMRDIVRCWTMSNVPTSNVPTSSVTAG